MKCLFVEHLVKFAYVCYVRSLLVLVFGFCLGTGAKHLVYHCGDVFLVAKAPPPSKGAVWNVLFAPEQQGALAVVQGPTAALPRYRAARKGWTAEGPGEPLRTFSTTCPQGKNKFTTILPQASAYQRKSKLHPSWTIVRKSVYCMLWT